MSQAVGDLTAAPSLAATRPRHRAPALPLMLLGCAVAVIGGVYIYLTTGEFVSTDDAYVQTGRVSVSTDVAGRVAKIDIRDNQLVRSGQTLFTLDDRPFRIAVEEAEAGLAAARLTVQAEKASYREAQADLRAAQETRTLREGEFDRQARLVASGAVSQAQYDQANHNLATARQNVIAVQQRLAGLLANLAGDVDIQPDRHPAVRQAQSVLDRAALNLSYTNVSAAQKGIVTKVDQLQIGDYVAAGVPVFSLMPARDIWIEANFKETDLAHMAPGQTASVTIDVYPDRTFAARVISFSPGTGSAFSLLPPENATGNWVKVGQRLPVRLEMDGVDGDLFLHAGLSATVEVETRYRNPIMIFIRRALGASR